MSSRKAKDDVFCHCRGPEDGFMIECESCKEWFHGTCVGVENQTEANNFIHWSCFVCVRVNNAVTKLMRDLSQHVKRSNQEVGALKREIATVKKRQTCSDELREEKSDLLQKISASKEEILSLKKTITSRDEALVAEREMFDKEKSDLLKSIRELEQQLQDVKETLVAEREIFEKEKSDLLKNIHILEQQLQEVKEETEEVLSLKQEVVNLTEKIAACEEEHISAQETSRKYQCDLVQNLQQQLIEEKNKSRKLESDIKGMKKRKLSLKLQSQEA